LRVGLAVGAREATPEGFGNTASAPACRQRSAASEPGHAWRATATTIDRVTSESVAISGFASTIESVSMASTSGRSCLATATASSACARVTVRSALDSASAAVAKP
jgi:hypothetical protein